MEGIELPIETGAEAVKLVRALGAHRYVAGRVHDVHAFVFEGARNVAEGDALASLADGLGWAARTLGAAERGVLDVNSKDPRLFRRASDDELVKLLTVYWASERAPAARAELSRLLEGVDTTRHDGKPFDEAHEADIFPLLVDAGWELLPLRQLDETRHKGVIDAYGERVFFDGAKFDEENAVPERVYLYELPALGETELLRGVDEDGALAAPLVLWSDCEPVYIDYLLRGITRAAAR